MSNEFQNLTIPPSYANAKFEIQSLMIKATRVDHGEATVFSGL